MRLGAHASDGIVTVGVNVTNEASRVFLCRPGKDGGEEHRTSLTRVSEHLWCGEIEDMKIGDHYGFRVHGPWDPRRGLRCNPNKLLIDPYARGHSSVLEIHDSQFNNQLDSAGFTPWGVVIQDDFDWRGTTKPGIPWQNTSLYEVHVGSFTRRHPGVPAGIRGTYLGLAHPATIEYLLSMGFRTLQLQPIHAIGHEHRLRQMGMVNHWGYSTLGYFAPHLGYSVSGTPQGAVREFKTMMRALHAAGIEVILDVVYNHTCEGDNDHGPVLSWRGLSARDYYLLDHEGRQLDYTGCLNTLNFTNDIVIEMVLDSLRYWATEMQVDGFRFDLAVTLGRDHHGFNRNHRLFRAIDADPALSTLKRVAEPWDTGPGGWPQTGKFTDTWRQQNDFFRDRVRRYWLVDAARNRNGEPTGGLGGLVSAIAGSADIFANSGLTTVNAVAMHDGFPLADLTRYNHRHNEANQENNRDGSDNNLSWNHGHEGSTSDEAINASRRQSMRNLLATVFLSIGTPMTTSGDEFGRTQYGNNNAYCQPEICDLNWHLEPWQEDLRETVRFLSLLRLQYRVLRRTGFFTGQPDNGRRQPDVQWLGIDGGPISADAWHHPHWRALQFYLHPESNAPGDSLLIMMQGANNGVIFQLPQHVHSCWKLLWSSTQNRPDIPAVFARSGSKVLVEPLSIRVYTGCKPDEIVQ